MCDRATGLSALPTRAGARGKRPPVVTAIAGVQNPSKMVGIMTGPSQASPAGTPPEPAALSANEALKQASRHLRGTLAEELADDTDHFSHDATLLLKFHGIYQQDDRDERRARTQAKQSLAYSCMVRAGFVGGMVTPEQWLAMDDLAVKICGGALRLTTRQDVQFHFVHKSELKELVGALNEHLVSTLAACGDVVRNTVCCPAPLAGTDQAALLAQAQAIAARLKPRTRGYWELWVDGEKAVTAEAPIEEEPLYGDTYLPRKFKIGFAPPGDNCIDVYSQDIGVVPSGEGFVLLVGGGLGMSHADDTTYPKLAEPLGWVAPTDLAEVIEAIVKVQRDHGNRVDRQHARLKYLVDGWGIDRFRAEVEAVWGGGRIAPAPELPAWEGSHSHLGWHEQPDGAWFLGLPVPDGRVRDTDEVALRTALRALVERFRPGLRITARQDLLLTDIAADDRAAVEAILREHGVALAEDLSPLRRESMACPALPTCGQALGEAERIMPKALDVIQDALDRAGLGQLEVHVRMTGCPNGCARPYTAEIGLVGRTKTAYDVWVGGARAGHRMARRLAKSVKLADLPGVLDPVFERYRDERDGDEALGDFCHRVRLGEVLVGVA